jgi:hypothetical protein
MRHLEDQAAALHPIVTAAGRDLRAWAKRIVWRHQNKDRDLTMIQIQFAYQALGMEPPKPGA